MSDQWFLDQARLGNMFHANGLSVTLSGLSTTATGLALSNPYGSGKDLVIRQMRFQPSTAPAGASIVYMAVSPAVSTTAVTHTTPAVIHNARTHGSNVNPGKALADTAATTVGTPVMLRALGSVVAASSITPAAYVDYTDGSIIVIPGTSIQFAFTTTAAVGHCSLTWVEVNAEAN